ncbi:Lrp/AsnC family transcriptional regulator, partial [Acinetobacter baumannii]
MDPAKVGLGLTVFVGIKAGEHSAEWYDRFVRGVANIPQVVEFYRMTGDLDYLIKVLVSDVADYDAVYKRLISIARMEDVS